MSLGDRMKLVGCAKKGVEPKNAQIFRCGRMQVQAISKAKESIITNKCPCIKKAKPSTKPSTKMLTILYTSGIVSGKRATCSSVRPCATVRSTTARKGTRKQKLQGVQWLVAKLQAEAYYCTACSERGGR